MKRLVKKSVPCSLYDIGGLQERLDGMELGKPVDKEQLYPVLSDAAIFGVDLYECGLAEKVIGYFEEMMAGPGAVRETLKKYVG